MLARRTIGAALLALVPPLLLANEDGIFDRYGASAPDSDGSCTSCHTGTTGFSGYSSTVETGGSAIAPGQDFLNSTAYTLTFSLEGSGASRGGFNLFVYNDDLDAGAVTGSFAGSGVSISGNQITHEDDNGAGLGGGRAASGGDVAWTFTWNTPSVRGNYILYYCGNPVDGDGNGFDADDGPAACGLVEVDVVNRAPNAVNDTFTVTEDSVNNTLSVLTEGVNDSDPDGDPITILSVSGVDPGASATIINASTQIRYTPAPDNDGTENFSYTITDGQGGEDTATVTVNITPQPDDPVITAGAATEVEMSVNSTPNPFDLDLVATDPDSGATLSWSISVPPAPGEGSAGACGGTTASGDACTITYNPAVDDVGLRSFTVEVDDGTGRTDSIVVTANIVSDPPEIRLDTGADAGAGQTVTMTEDLPATFDLTLQAFDLNGGTLTWSFDPAPTPPQVGSPSYGGNPTATNLSGENRVVSFTPVLNSNGDGAGAFTVVLTDNLGGTDEVDISVNITPVNDAPVAVDDTPADGDDPPLTIPVGGSNVFAASVLLANDTDVDGPPPANRTVTLISPSNDPDDGSSVQITTQLGGTVRITPPNQIDYTAPPDNVFGAPFPAGTADFFFYRLSDNHPTEALESETLAMVTVRPRDRENGVGDGVIDFLDNCPDNDNFDQANNDGDSQGDVCDPDDDNDGMTDDFENLYGLDQFDAADATEDPDGDGRNNLDEFLAGGNPLIDDVPPTVAAPLDLSVDATGYLTAVDLGNATSEDVREGLITAIPRLAVDVADACATGEQISSLHAFRPGRHAIYWTAKDNRLLLDGTPSGANCAFATQTLDVRPRASLAIDQFVEEGQTAQVGVTLNGAAPAYPVVISYSVGGTAGPGDHDAVNGSITIDSGTSGALSVQTSGGDASGEGNETVVFALLGASQAAVGRRTHTLTIVEGNVAPAVTLRVAQGADRGPLVVQTDGTVTVTATVIDANPGDAGAHTFDWSATHNALVDTDASANVFGFDPTSVASGVYPVLVSVTDPGGASASARVLVTVRDAAPALAATDTDGDGANDDAEGYQDSDGDGIAEHLDDGDLPGNLLQTETQDPALTLLIEGEQDVLLSLGATARHALRDGGAITAGDVQGVGGEGGSAAANGADEGFDNVGGLFDFEIAGLVPGAATRIVLPLRSAIRANAQYRKFTASGGWQAFVVDARNAVASAPRRAGVCPGPGATAYQAGLTPFHECVQLQLEDGGPNDADGLADGTVRDPGGVGVVAIEAARESTSSGSSRLREATLALLAFALLAARLRRCGTGTGRASRARRTVR